MSASLTDIAMNSAADVTRTFIKANPSVTPEEAVEMLLSVYDTLQSMRDPDAAVSAPAARIPAVPVSESIGPDGEYLVCLVDGTKLKMLKRYLKRFDMTPESYRAAYGLPADYPMSAPAYSALKAKEARDVGLGSRENKAGINKSRATGRELLAA